MSVHQETRNWLNLAKPLQGLSENAFLCDSVQKRPHRRVDEYAEEAQSLFPTDSAAGLGST